MTTPYRDLPKSRFWKTGVTEESPWLLGDIYRKKFSISASDMIATAGSCFAQHITRALRLHGYQLIDCEPAPARLPQKLHITYGYSMYSSRYGNIYTVKQLRQLAEEALEVVPARFFP
jgi:hypothetical protein